MSISAADTGSPIAVLDENGDIVGVNRAWEAFGDRNGLPEDYTAEGKNYAAIAQQGNDTYGNRVVAELRRLLSGEQTAFTAAYPCHSPRQERWFRLYATAVSFGDNQYYLLIHRRINQEPASREKHPSKGVDASTNGVTHQPRSRLVSYSLSSDESATDGVLMAFDAIGIDTQRQETTLQDWIDPDVVNALQSRTSDFHLTFRIWDYPVSLTPQEVIIYTPKRSSE